MGALALFAVRRSRDQERLLGQSRRLMGPPEPSATPVSCAVLSLHMTLVSYAEKRSTTEPLGTPLTTKVRFIRSVWRKNQQGGQTCLSSAAADPGAVSPSDEHSGATAGGARVLLN